MTSKDGESLKEIQKLNHQSTTKKQMDSRKCSPDSETRHEGMGKSVSVIYFAFLQQVL